MYYDDYIKLNLLIVEIRINSRAVIPDATSSSHERLIQSVADDRSRAH